MRMTKSISSVSLCPVMWGGRKAVKNYSEGVHPIRDGIVIDHICRGDSPSEIRNHMRLISKRSESGRGERRGVGGPRGRRQARSRNHFPSGSA
jgi:hypothetical protein